MTITNPDLSTSSYGYDGQDNLDSVSDERSLATTYVQSTPPVKAVCHSL